MPDGLRRKPSLENSRRLNSAKTAVNRNRPSASDPHAPFQFWQHHAPSRQPLPPTTNKKFAPWLRSQTRSPSPRPLLPDHPGSSGLFAKNNLASEGLARDGCRLARRCVVGSLRHRLIFQHDHEAARRLLFACCEFRVRWSLMRSRRDKLSSLRQKVSRGGPSNLIFIRLSVSLLLRIFSPIESRRKR